MRPDLFVIIVVSGAFYAFFVGIKALFLGIDALINRQGFSRQHAATLLFLTINLCEPAINILVIGSRIGRIGLLDTPSLPFAGILLLTAPMAVLAIPGAGIAFRQPYRSVCAKIFFVGVLRWIVTLYILCSVYGIISGENLLVEIVTGFGVLWASAWWGNRLLKDE